MWGSSPTALWSGDRVEQLGQVRLLGAVPLVELIGTICMAIFNLNP
ncbi:camphor resistance CrcB protein [Alicyclobacillus hesperidum URH17-3-68]|nr:camphor resistance CrcB protein [Alicyclobacillus hesperidum URH17-3-68]